MKSNVSEIKRSIQAKDDKKYKILTFDTDNLYPERVLSIVNGSGTAKSCVKLHARFITGGGFEDLKFWKAKINRKGTRVDQMFRALAKQYATHAGYSLHVNYNELFEISEINLIPFKHCRQGLPDDYGYIGKIAVYDNWDRYYGKIKPENIDYIDVFNPDPEVIQKQVDAVGGWDKYNGQVIYYKGEDESEEYPVPEFDSVLMDMETDALIQMFRNKNVDSSFMLQAILTTYGRFESDSERQNFNSGIEKFQGQNAKRILHVEVDESQGEKKPDLESFNTPNLDKLFEQTERSCKKSIISAFNQPQILHNGEQADKIGANDELETAYNYYNSITQDDRQLFEELFMSIIPLYRDDINPSGNYAVKELTFKNVLNGTPDK